VHRQVTVCIAAENCSRRADMNRPPVEASRVSQGSFLTLESPPLYPQARGRAQPALSNRLRKPRAARRFIEADLHQRGHGSKRQVRGEERKKGFLIPCGLLMPFCNKFPDRRH